MGRRPEQDDAEVILGAFPRRDHGANPVAQAPRSTDAEVIPIAPFLDARRARADAPSALPPDSA